MKQERKQEWIETGVAGVADVADVADLLLSKAAASEIESRRESQ